MANRLAYTRPEAAIDLYYIDVQHFGKNFEKFWGEVSSRINLINTSPVLVRENSHGYPVVRYEAPDTLKCREASYDLVVLSHGIVPDVDSISLAQLFDIGLAANGFFEEGTTPGISPSGVTSAGVFPAGACLYPMRIEECVEDASRVSQLVLRHLGKGM
jgi:heterodisulfide reductase subunit A-like polyferredoxin